MWSKMTGAPSADSAWSKLQIVTAAGVRSVVADVLLLGCCDVDAHTGLKMAMENVMVECTSELFMPVQAHSGRVSHKISLLIDCD